MQRGVPICLLNDIAVWRNEAHGLRFRAIEAGNPASGICSQANQSYPSSLWGLKAWQANGCSRKVEPQASDKGSLLC